MNSIELEKVLDSFRDPYYKVVVRGPAHSRSGYGEYTRSLLRILSQFEEMEDITLQSTPWGNTPLIWDQNHPDKEMLDKFTQMTAAEIKSNMIYDISYQVLLPNEWDSSIAEFNIGVTAATEVDRVCQQWQEACNKMDLIIAMSEHTKQTLLNGPIEITTPIIVLGSVIKDEFLVESDSYFDLDIDEKVQDLYLHIGQISGDPQRDRKNTYGLIYSFKRAFRDDPTKALVLKVNTGRNNAFDRSQTYAVLKNFLLSNGLDQSKAKIYLLHGPMTDKQMADLYRHPKLRCFVSFTRGEGFGLPFLEAAASGVPVLATDHSSYVEFLKNKNEKLFFMASPAIMEVPERYCDGMIIPKGAKWAEVHPEEMVRTLVKFDENFKKESINRKAALAKDNVISLYNLTNLAFHLQSQLKEHFPDRF